MIFNCKYCGNKFVAISQASHFRWCCLHCTSLTDLVALISDAQLPAGLHSLLLCLNPRSTVSFLHDINNIFYDTAWDEARFRHVLLLFRLKVNKSSTQFTLKSHITYKRISKSTKKYLLTINAELTTEH
ncbi:CLUMA_CG002898, isoform A [Clunio marinus]|uniref:CLUMA_CG002898, isoform A n=1 Tax=Clunio marinus TaxID=568069 RepID=A0A1J1HSG5_9DIPT|nr:CLUMA_CG002898, isoform A [Clunio marinus]